MIRNEEQYSNKLKKYGICLFLSSLEIIARYNCFGCAMSNNIKNKISEIIISHSNGDARLGELLSYCVGRLCLSFDKAGKDWEEALSSVDLPHIVDWLKAAIINEADWLKNVDDKNRPKKLMKFGSFEDIQKEADKAMKIANQQNSDIKLIEGDEELYMQLEDGYHLVKLLAPAALDREGSLMQHCIGGGAYDEALNNNVHYFLSLRDRYGKPHATLEINGNSLTQLQGKQNQAPNIKYTETLKPFFAEANLAINIPIKTLGYVISSEGDSYDIGNLPDGLEVGGDLDFRGVPINSLPEGLKVGGSLKLEGTPIKSLPRRLCVSGSLSLRGSSVESLPEGLKVGGDLDLERTSIKSLSRNLEVCESLSLKATVIEYLPEGLKVGGDLDLYGASIKSLPKGLEVGGYLDFRDTPVKQLPEGLKVGGKIYGFRNQNNAESFNP